MDYLIEQRKKVDIEIEKLIEDFKRLMYENNLPYVIGCQKFCGIRTVFEGNSYSLKGITDKLKEEVTSNEYDDNRYDN